MAKMIQIRNVPEGLHRTLKAKAAERGLSLSDYLLRMAERESNRLSIEELSARIQQRGRVDLGVDVADLVRDLRAENG